MLRMAVRTENTYIEYLLTYYNMSKGTDEKMSSAKNVEFDWVQLSEDLDLLKRESFLQKTNRKFKENPFVPIGALGAVGALTYGLHAMCRSDARKSQIAMRARIGFQGFAIASLIIGFIIGPPQNKKAE